MATWSSTTSAYSTSMVSIPLSTSISSGASITSYVTNNVTSAASNVVICDNRKYPLMLVAKATCDIAIDTYPLNYGNTYHLNCTAMLEEIKKGMQVFDLPAPITTKSPASVIVGPVDITTKTVTPDASYLILQACSNYFIIHIMTPSSRVLSLQPDVYLTDIQYTDTVYNKLPHSATFGRQLTVCREARYSFRTSRFSDIPWPVIDGNKIYDVNASLTSGILRTDRFQAVPVSTSNPLYRLRDFPLDMQELLISFGSQNLYEIDVPAYLNRCIGSAYVIRDYLA